MYVSVNIWMSYQKLIVSFCATASVLYRSGNYRAALTTLQELVGHPNLTPNADSCPNPLSLLLLTVLLCNCNHDYALAHTYITMACHSLEDNHRAHVHAYSYIIVCMYVLIGMYVCMYVCRWVRRFDTCSGSVRGFADSCCCSAWAMRKRRPVAYNRHCDCSRGTPWPWPAWLSVGNGRCWY